MVDLNVLLDVVQRREPFYAASAAALSKLLTPESTGCIPGHALTTLDYPPTEGWIECPVDGCTCRQTWSLEPEVAAQIRTLSGGSSSR
jgi:hypothetical protein